MIIAASLSADCRLGDSAPGTRSPIQFGTSIFLIAVGAILRYAVTGHISGIRVHTVGLILMVVGVIGLILSLLYMFLVTRRRPAVDDPYYDDPRRTRTYR
jgi:hypothetical protein